MSPILPCKARSTTSQAAYANSFTALPAENAGVAACYPGLTGVTLIHFYAKLELAVGEPYSIISFGGGYQMGNSGAPNTNGGAFGVGASVSSAKQNLFAWMRDDSEAGSPTAWMTAEGMGSFPSLDQVDLNDGAFHSIQVLFMPGKAQTPARQGWVVGYIDGEQAGLQRPWKITTGVTAGSAPTGVGYDCLLFLGARNTGATFDQGFNGVCKQLQVWKFDSLPDNIDLAIKEFNARPRSVPLALKGVA